MEQLITKDEYHNFLNRKLEIKKTNFFILITISSSVLLPFIDIVEFGLSDILTIKIFLTYFVTSLFLGGFFTLIYPLLSYKRESFSHIEVDSSLSEEHFEYCIPCSLRKHFKGTIEGTLYLGNNKIWFIANRVVGIKQIYFKLADINSCKYDYFIDDLSVTEIKLKDKPKILKWISVNLYKDLIIVNDSMKMNISFLSNELVIEKIEKVVKFT